MVSRSKKKTRVWNRTRVAFNLPSFYLSSTTWSWWQAQQRKSAASRDHKVTPTWLKEPFKGEPPGTGKFWRCHRQFRKVAISSCLWTPGLNSECSGIDRILIMILKTLRTEFKDRFPPKFHQKSHKTKKQTSSKTTTEIMAIILNIERLKVFP